MLKENVFENGDLIYFHGVAFIPIHITPKKLGTFFWD
jgi:hypothetical protein